MSADGVYDDDMEDLPDFDDPALSELLGDMRGRVPSSAPRYLRPLWPSTSKRRQHRTGVPRCAVFSLNWSRR